MKKLFYVEYLVGGSSNFTARRIVGLYSKEACLPRIEELQKMGYPAMSVDPAIGGFEFFNSFDSDSDRIEYFNSICKKFLPSL